MDTACGVHYMQSAERIMFCILYVPPDLAECDSVYSHATNARVQVAAVAKGEIEEQEVAEEVSATLRRNRTPRAA